MRLPDRIARTDVEAPLSDAEFYDLVIEIAIVPRAHSMAGWCIDLRRKAGLEAVSYPSLGQKVLSVLSGVPIFRSCLQLRGAAAHRRRADQAGAMAAGNEKAASNLSAEIARRHAPNGYPKNSRSVSARSGLEVRFPRIAFASFALLAYVSDGSALQRPRFRGFLNSPARVLFAFVLVHNANDTASRAPGRRHRSAAFARSAVAQPAAVRLGLRMVKV